LFTQLFRNATEMFVTPVLPTVYPIYIINEKSTLLINVKKSLQKTDIGTLATTKNTAKLERNVQLLTNKRIEERNAIQTRV